MPDRQRISDIKLDERSVVRRSPQVEHEHRVAVFDLLEENHFAPIGDFHGPYMVALRIEEDRIVLEIKDEDDVRLTDIAISTKSLRRVIKDYFMICESYFEAIKTKAPSQIEAIDMGRRGLHNEGADILRDRLADKVDIDPPTARRLFTLICVLHVRG